MSGVDVAAVELAVYEAIQRHWPNAMDECASNETECESGEDCASDVAHAALRATLTAPSTTAPVDDDAAEVEGGAKVIPHPELDGLWAVREASGLTFGTYLLREDAELAARAVREADMVERMARSIYYDERAVSPVGQFWPDWEDLPSEGRTMYCTRAHRALAAARRSAPGALASDGVKEGAGPGAARVSVTSAQVERRAREKANAEAVAQGALPYADASWACVRGQYIDALRTDLTALGIEVRR